MLGHASYVYTADTYTHVLPQVAHATAHLILTELAHHHTSSNAPPALTA